MKQGVLIFVTIHTFYIVCIQQIQYLHQDMSLLRKPRGFRSFCFSSEPFKISLPFPLNIT